MFGDEAGGNSVDNSRTKITTQQKTKYVMHMCILIAAHIFVFWYIPISGNTKLYGNAQCDLSQE